MLITTGSGIAPFFPIPRESSGLYLPLHILLFVVRVPLVIAAGLGYIVAFSWVPAPAVIHQGALWLILQMAGAWWVDLQIDGVKRG